MTAAKLDKDLEVSVKAKATKSQLALNRFLKRLETFKTDYSLSDEDKVIKDYIDEKKQALLTFLTDENPQIEGVNVWLGNENKNIDDLIQNLSKNKLLFDEIKKIVQDSRPTILKTTDEFEFSPAASFILGVMVAFIIPIIPMLLGMMIYNSVATVNNSLGKSSHEKAEKIEGALINLTMEERQKQNILYDQSQHYKELQEALNWHRDPNKQQLSADKKPEAATFLKLKNKYIQYNEGEVQEDIVTPNSDSGSIHNP